MSRKNPSFVVSKRAQNVFKVLDGHLTAEQVEKVREAYEGAKQKRLEREKKSKHLQRD